MGKALVDIGSLAFVVLVVLFVFTVLGAALFSNQLKFNEDNYYDPVHGKSPRANFDNLSHAFISVFVIV